MLNMVCFIKPVLVQHYFLFILEVLGSGSGPGSASKAMRLRNSIRCGSRFAIGKHIQRSRIRNRIPVPVF
jgi:hypothetical protein